MLHFILHISTCVSFGSEAEQQPLPRHEVLRIYYHLLITKCVKENQKFRNNFDSSTSPL